MSLQFVLNYLKHMIPMLLGWNLNQFVTSAAAENLQLAPIAMLVNTLVMKQAVSDRIMKVKEKDVMALNYSEDEINCAIRVSNGGSNHAEGFSQSQHNWDESEDYSGIALNINKWDVLVNPAPAKGSSAHAEAQPHLRDLQKALEGLMPEG
jgi:hypothetical protein